MTQTSYNLKGFYKSLVLNPSEGSVQAKLGYEGKLDFAIKAGGKCNRSPNTVLGWVKGLSTVRDNDILQTLSMMSGIPVENLFNKNFN